MRSVIAFVLVVITFSCESGIDTVDESGSVPVIYCILNQNGTTQNLRLSRSYLSGNALLPPDSPDSLLVPGIVNLSIEGVDNTGVITSANLLPWPADKDSGFFPYSRHVTYRAVFPVFENRTYRLVVDIPEWDLLAYASVQSLGDFRLVDPAYPEARKLHLVDDHNLQVHWTRSIHAAIYQIGFRVHYQEFRSDEALRDSCLLLFTTAFYREDPGNYYTYPVNSNQFYKRLAESISSEPSVLRQLTAVDVFVIAASESVGFYLKSLESQDPFQLFEYGNIINGRGFFGISRTREARGFALDDQSLDSLAYGRYTNSLNFLDSDGHRKQ